jgi:hypothetical protein
MLEHPRKPSATASTGTDPAVRPAWRRQDLLRASDRGRVRPQLHPRLDRRPRLGDRGGSARNIDKAFETAEQNLPCLLFFDEFDSVAQRRDNTPDQESRRTVNQLLTSLEAHHGERELLVMAATNSVEHLDPAVIRPGRFDRHIRIDLPDAGRAARDLSHRARRPAPPPASSTSTSSSAAPRG